MFPISVDIAIVIFDNAIYLDPLSNFMIVLSVSQSKVLKSLTVFVDLSVSPFSSTSFYFANFAALQFGVYAF